MKLNVQCARRKGENSADDVTLEADISSNPGPKSLARMPKDTPKPLVSGNIKIFFYYYLTKNAENFVLVKPCQIGSAALDEKHATLEGDISAIP